MNFLLEKVIDRDILTMAKKLDPRLPTDNYTEQCLEVAKYITSMIDMNIMSLEVALGLLFHYAYVMADITMAKRLTKYCRSLTSADVIVEIDNIISSDNASNSELIRATYILKYNNYDKQIWPGAEAIPKLLGMIPVKKMSNAIDLGCGTGRAGEILLRSGFCGQLTGVDLSPHMLSLARNKGTYHNLIEGNIIDWLFNNSQQFDIVMACWITAHFTFGEIKKIVSMVRRSVSEGYPSGRGRLPGPCSRGIQ